MRDFDKGKRIIMQLASVENTAASNLQHLSVDLSGVVLTPEIITNPLTYCPKLHTLQLHALNTEMVGLSNLAVFETNDSLKNVEINFARLRDKDIVTRKFPDMQRGGNTSIEKLSVSFSAVSRSSNVTLDIFEQFFAMFKGVKDLTIQALPLEKPKATDIPFLPQILQGMP